MKDSDKKSLLLSLYLLIITIALLSGCTEDNVNGNGLQQDDKDKSKQMTKKVNVIQAPIKNSTGEIGQVVGWLSNDTVVYLVQTQDGSTVYTYHLDTGKSVELFKSQDPIISVYISHSGEKLLIQSSSSNAEAVITVINKQGKQLVTKEINSTELAIEWNPFNENLVLVTAFNDQWDYNVSILDIENKDMTDAKLTTQPFAHWLTRNEFVYLDWDIDNPALFAPVVMQRIDKAQVEQLDLSNVFQLFMFQDVLLTVSIDIAHEEQAIYTFQTNRLKSLFTFTMPHLTEFSDWLVPYHDYNASQKKFITFRPVSSGSIDTYQSGFELVQYHLNGDKEEVILEGLENKPLSYSPDGKYCLYGYQFEKLINFETKEMVSLVEGL
ncbi:hypothetical protein [Bacillus sp. T3]|uniref:YqgU-like beta propeller domain-containing protein n=1 Tax=Bacillus sp. T3 TaxID=467262 RepID=UPI0029826390|nr:hypothetical protein [Bacillus sp. T3]